MGDSGVRDSAISNTTKMTVTKTTPAIRANLVYFTFHPSKVTFRREIVLVYCFSQLWLCRSINQIASKASFYGDPDRIRGHMCNTSIYSMHFVQQGLRHQPDEPRFLPMLYQNCWASERPTVFASWPVNTVSPMKVYVWHSYEPTTPTLRLNDCVA